MNTQNQLTATDGPAGSLALDPRYAPFKRGRTGIKGRTKYIQEQTGSWVTLNENGDCHLGANHKHLGTLADVASENADLRMMLLKTTGCMGLLMSGTNPSAPAYRATYDSAKALLASLHNTNVQRRSGDQPAGASVLKPTDQPPAPERSL